MKQTLGKSGEDTAVSFLQTNGYKIIQRNFRSRFGEIDIIAYDHTQNMLVFVEVRLKSTSNFGWAEESLTQTKKERLLKTAYYYLSNGKYHAYRFDLIAINLFTKETLKHYKNIITI